eukprot:488322-Prorocentrum_minimum.AAC.1
MADTVTGKNTNKTRPKSCPIGTKSRHIPPSETWRSLEEKRIARENKLYQKRLADLKKAPVSSFHALKLEHNPAAACLSHHSRNWIHIGYVTVRKRATKTRYSNKGLVSLPNACVHACEQAKRKQKPYEERHTVIYEREQGNISIHGRLTKTYSRSPLDPKLKLDCNWAHRKEVYNAHKPLQPSKKVRRSLLAVISMP